MKRKHLKPLKSVLSIVLSLAMLITGLYVGPVNDASAAPGDGTEPAKLCELTFDGADALDAGAATATAPSGYDTVDYNGGKALYLDGTNQYVSITKSDGSGLLAGKEEFTISFDIYVFANGTNWGFYAAPEDVVPQYNTATESYLGSLFNGDGNVNLTVERYYRGRVDTSRSSSFTKNNIGAYNSWHHIDEDRAVQW